MDVEAKKFEIIVIGILLILSIVFIVEAQNPQYYSSGSEVSSNTLPLLVFWSVVIGCVFLIIQRVIKNKNEGKNDQEISTNYKEKLYRFFPHIPGKTLMTLLLMIIYIAIWNQVGFIISSILFTFALTWALAKKRSLFKSVLLAILFPFAIYIFFRLLLLIPLPGFSW